MLRPIARSLPAYDVRKSVPPNGQETSEQSIVRRPGAFPLDHAGGPFRARDVGFVMLFPSVSGVGMVVDLKMHRGRRAGTRSVPTPGDRSMANIPE